MGRAPCCDKASVKKGPWSPEEDAKLKAYIEENGTGGNWIALPQKIGLKRCGKSCRLRWLNYLRPNIKHGDFTEEEEHIICSLYISIGSRWSIIAAQLPGRTDNDIKNYWNTKLKKKLLGKQAPSRRTRANQEPYLLASAAGAGSICSSSSNDTAAAAAQTLSSSALERIQLHMRLQGIYNSAANAAAAAVPPQWPKLETLVATKALPPPATVSLQQPQSLVGQATQASLVAVAAVDAEQRLCPTAVNYMPGSLDERSCRLGFSSPAAEAEVAGEMMASGAMVGGYSAGGYDFHEELYDFLYNKCGSVGGGADGAGIAPLPELQCPDGGAVVGADEKFSAWTASCDYGLAGQLQGNSINLQDYVLRYDDQ